jgi:hypothetical protein
MNTLIDRKGEKFTLRGIAAPDGCSVEVLNAHTLYTLDKISEFKDSGFAALRVITDDAEILRMYAASLKSPDSQVGSKYVYKPANGITRGHFFRGPL